MQFMRISLIAPYSSSEDRESQHTKKNDPSTPFLPTFCPLAALAPATRGLFPAPRSPSSMSLSLPRAHRLLLHLARPRGRGRVRRTGLLLTRSTPTLLGLAALARGGVARVAVVRGPMLLVPTARFSRAWLLGAAAAAAGGRHRGLHLPMGLRRTA